MTVQSGALETYTLIDPPQVALGIKDREGVLMSLAILTPKAARDLARALIEHARTVEKLLEGGVS